MLSGWWLIEEHIAEALVESGDQETAESMYRDIVARTGLPEFMDAIAELQLEGGEHEAFLSWARRAEEAYNERTLLFPEAVAGHALEHWIAFGQPERAVELAERNVANSPNGDALTQLVHALLRAGDSAGAAEAADRALATDYSSADLHAAAASAFSAAGREADAEVQRIRAQSIDPRLREF
jgi:tetratricopeptide (TPR) repeat protein